MRIHADPDPQPWFFHVLLMKPKRTQRMQPSFMKNAGSFLKNAKERKSTQENSFRKNAKEHMDPHSFFLLDPDTHSICGSGSAY